MIPSRLFTIISVCGVGLGLAGCSLFGEGGRTTAEGTVVDSNSGNPIGPAQVSLFTSKRGSASAVLTQAGNWRDTDAQGRFSFSFDADANLDYVVRATSRRGETDYLTAPRLKGGRKNKDVRVPIFSPAWVSVHLVDVPPRTDALSISVGGFPESFTISTPLDTTIVRFIEPGENLWVLWQLNGGQMSSNDERRSYFSVAGMDTARVELRY